MSGETNLRKLISSMKPILNVGEFVFISAPAMQVAHTEIIMQFAENEGVTLICTKNYADNFGLEYEATFAWITLQVHSSLEAVGLTAAFSTALAKHEISCNVVAGFYHDHIFVPTSDAHQAVKSLESLAANY
jgi:uncharacterized protein